MRVRKQEDFAAGGAAVRGAAGAGRCVTGTKREGSAGAARHVGHRRALPPMIHVGKRPMAREAVRGMNAEVGDEVKKSLGYQAFDRIKDDIVWCRLSPGEEVSEARLCELYGLGKAPIRQALSRLVQEGYVISVPRRGHFIAPVTLQSVKDLFELRLLLEPAAVEGACGRADAERLAKLDAQCARGYRPGDAASEAAFMAANRAFHLEIARACGNVRLTKVLAQIIDEMTRLLHLGFVLRERPEEMTHEHKDLVEAIVAGDRARARTIAIDHIRSVRALVVDGIVTHTNLSNITIVPN